MLTLLPAPALRSRAISASLGVRAPSRGSLLQSQGARFFTKVCMYVYCMCMHVCMYVCMHVCIHIIIYICIYTCIYIYIDILIIYTCCGPQYCGIKSSSRVDRLLGKRRQFSTCSTELCWRRWLCPEGPLVACSWSYSSGQKVGT